PAAQARNKRPRVELARLTVSEYRNALADLVAPPRPGKTSPPNGAKDEAGLRGSYFTNPNRRKRTLVFSRLDPAVRFDFGPSSPDYEKLNSGEIAVDWQGSVVAPDTGLYDFIVRTEHSTRLWV